MKFKANTLTLCTTVLAGVLGLMANTMVAQMPMGGGPPGMGMMDGSLIMGRISTAKGPAGNVELLLTNQKNGKTRKAQSDANGFYQIRDLRAGTYTLTITGEGYKTSIVKNIQLKEGPCFVDRKLTEGASTETESADWAPTKPMLFGKPGGKPSAGEVNGPMSSRNYTQSASTSDGVSGSLNNASSVGIGLSAGFHVGGSNTNNFMTDGAPVATGISGAAAPPIPNPDAISTTAMEAWSYSAGPQRYSGANIIATTKSGGELLHGTLFEFDRNDIFNANEYFRKNEGLGRPVLKQNQFGFTLGGPIRSQRDYFFVAYQGTRQSNALAPGGTAPSVHLAPLPEDRTAASVGAAMCPANHSFGSDYTTMLFSAGGMQVACDGSNINSIALKILNLKLANGNYYVPGSGASEFVTTTFSHPAKFQEDQFLINTDFNLGAKHKLAERFFFSRSPQTQYFTAGPTSLPGNPEDTLHQNLNAVLRLVTSFTPKFANEFHLSGQRDIMNDTPDSPFTNTELGITSLNSNFPQMDLINIMGVLALGGNGNWDRYNVNQYQAADSISWIHGRHSIHAAFEAELRQDNVWNLSPARGTLTYMSFADFLLSLPGCAPGTTIFNGSCAEYDANGQAVSSGVNQANIFQSSAPGGAAATLGDNGANHAYRYAEYSTWLQDDIKISDRLTLNLGLRWDYFGNPTDSTGNMTLFMPGFAGDNSAVSDGKATYAGFVVPANFKGTLENGVVRSSRNSILNDASKKNFAPRLGLAWKPLAKSDLTIRSGYGIFYDRPDSNTLELQSLTEAPYAATTGEAASANYKASLAKPFTVCAESVWGCARTSDATALTSSNLNVKTLDPTILAGQVQKWNLEIAKNLPGRVDVKVDYAGEHAIHLQAVGHQINQAKLASDANAVNGITTNTATNAALRVPYRGIAPAGLDQEGSFGSAKYHALQLSAGSMLPAGVMLRGSWSITKTISNLGVAMPSTGIMGAGTGMTMNVNDTTDIRHQYGPMAMNSPQRFTLMYGWMLPFHFTGIRKEIFEGWNVMGMYVLMDGAPLTITDATGGGVYGSAGTSTGSYYSGYGRKNAATSGSAKKRINAYFNTSAVGTALATGNTTTGNFMGATYYGTTGQGIVDGPGQNNTDMSISKKSRVFGNNLDLRVELFNVFNHAQFSAPDTGASDPSTVFGHITQTSVNPRLIQLGMKYAF